MPDLSYLAIAFNSGACSAFKIASSGASAGGNVLITPVAVVCTYRGCGCLRDVGYSVGYSGRSMPVNYVIDLRSPHSPIGRGSGLKIRQVSVRVRLGAPCFRNAQVLPQL